MFLNSFINTLTNERYKLITRSIISMLHEQYILEDDRDRAVIDDEYHEGVHTITIVIKKRLGGKDEHLSNL